jgi:riboflavin transporter
MSQDAPDLFSGAFFVQRSWAQRLPVNARRREGKTMPTQNEIKPKQTNRNRVRWIAKTGILAGIAVVLMYLEFSIPLMPSFLKFDFSEIAVMLATFSMGPLTGILVELLKNLIHYPFTSSNGVGEIANFLVGSAFVGTAGIIYRYYKTRAGAAISMASGTVAMTLVACLVNYFIVLPFYFTFFPLEAIIGMCRDVGNTGVKDLWTLILYVFVPFNLLKGTVISLIVAVIYKRLSPILHR